MGNINVVEDLLGILSSKIKKFEKELRKQMAADPNKEVIKKIIEDIKNDRYAIANISQNDLMSYFSKYLVSTHEFDVEEIDSFFARYKVTEAVARGYTKGIMIKYDLDDEKTVDKLVEYLERCLVAIENMAKGGTDRELDKTSFAPYYRLYDKLRDGEGLEFLSKEDIELITELIGSKDMNYYRQAMEYIHEYNRNVYDNKVVDAKETIDNIGNPVGEKRKYSIDEDLLKKIFDEYGFTLAGMPEDIYSTILATCDSGRIIDIFDFINSNPKYHFLKSFGASSYVTEDDKGKKIEIPKNKTLIRREFVVLYQIIRFSNKSILRNLIDDCEKKNVSLEEVLLKVKGVVKHVTKSRNVTPDNANLNDDYSDINCVGTFENYIANSNELIKLGKEYHGCDFLHYALCCETYSEWLGTNAAKFKNNIELLKKYGFEFTINDNPKTVETMPWIVALGMDTGLLRARIDLLIENGVRTGTRDESYNYFLKYPSVLYYNEKIIKAIVCKSYNGELSYRANGQLHAVRREVDGFDEEYYSKQIERPSLAELRKDVPEKYRTIAEEAQDIDFNYSDEYLDRLEGYIFGEGSALDGLAYIIGDVVVSLPKVKRIWKAIRNNYSEDYDLDKLFVFALTYGSYYDDSELLELNSVINERKFD